MEHSLFLKQAVERFLEQWRFKYICTNSPNVLVRHNAGVSNVYLKQHWDVLETRPEVETRILSLSWNALFKWAHLSRILALFIRLISAPKRLKYSVWMCFWTCHGKVLVIILCLRYVIWCNLALPYIFDAHSNTTMPLYLCYFQHSPPLSLFIHSSFELYHCEKITALTCWMSRHPQSWSHFLHRKKKQMTNSDQTAWYFGMTGPRLKNLD